MTKTVTFKDLLKDNDSFNITYAKKGTTPKQLKVDKVEDVLSFISDNIYEINLLSINEVILDIDKIIEKYSK